MTLAQTIAAAATAEIEIACDGVAIAFRIKRIDSAMLKAKGVNVLLAATSPEMRMEARRMVQSGEMTNVQAVAFLAEAVSPEEMRKWENERTRLRHGCVAAGVVAWRAKAADAPAWPEWEPIAFTLDPSQRDPDAGVLCLPGDLPGPVLEQLESAIEAHTNGGLARSVIPFLGTRANGEAVPVLPEAAQ